MAKELACEACGTIWLVEGHPMLKVKMQSCKKCGKFKFQLEPLSKVFAANTVEVSAK